MIRRKKVVLPTGIEENDTLTPYLLDAKQAEMDSSEETSFLDWIIDIIRRPDYVYGNLMEEGIEDVRDRDGFNLMDYLVAIKEGLLGERKGSTTNVFFGGQNEGKKGEYVRGLWENVDPSTGKAKIRNPYPDATTAVIATAGSLGGGYVGGKLGSNIGSTIGSIGGIPGKAIGGVVGLALGQLIGNVLPSIAGNIAYGRPIEDWGEDLVKEQIGVTFDILRPKMGNFLPRNTEIGKVMAEKYANDRLAIELQDNTLREELLKRVPVNTAEEIRRQINKNPTKRIDYLIGASGEAMKMIEKRKAELLREGLNMVEDTAIDRTAAIAGMNLEDKTKYSFTKFEKNIKSQIQALSKQDANHPRIPILQNMIDKKNQTDFYLLIKDKFKGKTIPSRLSELQSIPSGVNAGQVPDELKRVIEKDLLSENKRISFLQQKIKQPRTDAFDKTQYRRPEHYTLKDTDIEPINAFDGDTYTKKNAQGAKEHFLFQNGNWTQITNTDLAKIRMSASKSTTTFTHDEYKLIEQAGIDFNYSKIGSKEFTVLTFLGHGYKVTNADNPILKTMTENMKRFDEWKRNIGQMKIPFGKGKTYSDAFWSVLSNGRIGLIKRLFNFRNPYEETIALRMAEIRQGSESHLVELLEASLGKNAAQSISNFSDDIKQKFVSIKSLAEYLQFKKNEPNATFGNVASAFANNPQNQLKVTQKDIADLNLLDNFYNNIMRTYAEVENDLAVRHGNNKQYRYMKDYIPLRMRDVDNKDITFKKYGTYFSTPTMERSGTLFEETMKDKETLARFLDASTSDEVLNTIMLQGGGFPIVNLDDIIIERTKDHVKLVRRDEIFESLKPFGIDPSKGAENFKALGLSDKLKEPNTYKRLGLARINDQSGALRNYLFDGEIRNIIDNTVHLATDENMQVKLLDGIDKVIATWKSIKLAYPGFVGGNIISNTITGYIHYGVSWLDSYKQRVAQKIATWFLAGIDKRPSVGTKLFGAGGYAQFGGQRFGNTKWTIDELRNYAIDTGLLTRRSMAADTKSQISSLGFRENTSWNPLNQNFKGYEKIREWGTYSEAKDKMVAFLAEVEKLDQFTPTKTYTVLQQASRKAKQIFIDYEDISSFEKNWMRRLAPFYTWTRKNLANQVLIFTEAARNTMMKGNIRNIAEILKNGEIETDESLSPDYVKESGFSAKSKDNKGNVFSIGVNASYNDLSLLPFVINKEGMPELRLGKIFDAVIDKANPVLKAGVEIAQSRDISNKIAIEGNEMAAPSRGLASLVKGARDAISNNKAVGFIDGFLNSLGFTEDKIRYNEKGEIVIDKNWALILDNLAPVVKRMNDYFENTQTLVSGAVGAVSDIDVNGLVEYVTQAKDKNDATERVLNFMSFVFGIRSQKYNENDERFYRASNIVNTAEARRSFMRTPEEKRKTQEESRQSREKRYRRLGVL